MGGIHRLQYYNMCTINVHCIYKMIVKQRAYNVSPLEYEC